MPVILTEPEEWEAWMAAPQPRLAYSPKTKG